MFDLQNNYLDKYDPWAGTIAATGFSLSRTYHTTLQSQWFLDMTSY